MNKLKKYKKTKITRTHKIIISFILIVLTLGVGYSALITNLSISGNITVKEYDDQVLFNKIVKLSQQPDSCIYKYEGPVTDEVEVTKTNAENVYYNRCVDKRNILFANTCWQMIRTTETGGIKMIYNGEPDENGQCLSTRGNHVGYVERTVDYMNTTYYYGTDYTYDKINSVFQLSGTVTTGEIKTGEYTCKATSDTDTCATLYYVDTLTSSGVTYFVITLNNNSNYAEYGRLSFNQSFSSLADMGYMNNISYAYSYRPMTSTETMLSSASLNTTYYYGDGVTWGTPTAYTYNLNNPVLVSGTGDYPSLVGKYTFRNTNQTYTNTSVYYIAAVNGSTMYYIQLQESTNHNLSDYNNTYTYGDTYTDNGNGTFTVKNNDNSNPTTIHRSDWYNYYTSVKHQYVCKNANNNICSNLWYITLTSSTSMTYLNVAHNYKYAKGFTYDENTGKYTLNSDSVAFWDINDSTNQTSLNNHHYTCFNISGECATLYYIYYLSGSSPYYIQLKNGKSVSDAINEMLYNNEVNTYDSTIKTGIDVWYKKYLKDKTNMLEDAVYCNARDMINQSTNGWNPDGGSISQNTYFKNYTLNNDISCSNVTDQFAVGNNQAKLTYPVGLATHEELYTLTNNNTLPNLIKTNVWWWDLSPSYYYNLYGHANVRAVDSDGYVNYGSNGGLGGVRLVVSLVSGAAISSGEGSESNPWVIQE